MNLLNLVLRPQMRKLFGFSEINEITFSADFINDTLNLTGEGFFNGLKGGENLKRLHGNTLKLSENKDQTQVVEDKIRSSLNPKQIDFVNYHIDFLNKETKVLVRYIDQNGNKKENNSLGTKF